MTGAETSRPVGAEPKLSDMLRDEAKLFAKIDTEQAGLFARRLNAYADMALLQEMQLAEWKQLQHVEAERAGGMQ